MVVFTPITRLLVGLFEIPLVILFLPWQKVLVLWKSLLLKRWLFMIVSLLFLNSRLQNLIVEGDSKTLNSKIDIPWRIKFLVLDILNLARRFSSIVFHHIPREANFMANNLANLGHSASLLFRLCNQLMLSSNSLFQFNWSIWRCLF